MTAAHLGVSFGLGTTDHTTLKALTEWIKTSVFSLNQLCHESSREGFVQCCNNVVPLNQAYPYNASVEITTISLISSSLVLIPLT